MGRLAFDIETYLQRHLSFVAYYMYRNLSHELFKRSANTITLSDLELLTVTKIHSLQFMYEALSELRHKRLIICAVSSNNDDRTTYSLRLPAIRRMDVPQRKIA